MSYRKLKIILFNNSLTFKINLLYFLYQISCVLISNLIPERRSNKNRTLYKELKENGFVKVTNVFNTDEISNIRKNIEVELSKGNNFSNEFSHIFSQIQNPISKCCIDINTIYFNPQINGLLKNYYKSNFRIKWIDCYRSYPTKDLQSSWKWHCDNHPYGVLKGIILLTDQDENSGAMQIFDKNRTKRIKYAGYDGNRMESRLDDLSDICNDLKIEKKANYLIGKAGDMFLFEANNLHKATPPLHGFRDASTILILPYFKDKKTLFNKELTNTLESSSGGWPPRPWL